MYFHAASCDALINHRKVQQRTKNAVARPVVVLTASRALFCFNPSHHEWSHPVSFFANSTATPRK